MFFGSVDCVLTLCGLGSGVGGVTLGRVALGGATLGRVALGRVTLHGSTELVGTLITEVISVCSVIVSVAGEDSGSPWDLPGTSGGVASAAGFFDWSEGLLGGVDIVERGG